TVTLAPFLSRNVACTAPFEVSVFALPSLLPLSVIVTGTSPTGAAFSLTIAFTSTAVHNVLTFLPLTVVVLKSFFFPTERRICVGIRTAFCTSTVPAGFGLPVFGVYGVHSDRQRYSPAVVGLVGALAPNVADSSFAPNAARPGVPWGTSGGGRQIWSLNCPSACSVPAVATTNTGTSRVCPAAVRWRSHVAATVATPHCACCVSKFFGSTASSSPVSGRIAPPRSAACAVACTSPSC